MTDLVLARINARASWEEFQPIPFPAETAPRWLGVVAKPGDPPPKADVAVMTFTAAEKEALAKVWTPGYPYDSWRSYTHNWAEYEPHLTDRSPAREAKSLGSYALVTVGGLRVLLFGSELHPAEDDVTMPLRALWRQIIQETGCVLSIDTGTAGGVGSEVVEGDVLITNAVQCNYTGMFKDQPFAHERFVSAPYTPGPNVQLAFETLIPVNAGRLKPVATRNPILWAGDCETVDEFAFAAPGDPYGIVKADSQARMEEMDLGALALACADLGSAAPRWLSSRCASDPEVKAGTLQAEKREADQIYEHDGGPAAVGSAIACWGIVADLAASSDAGRLQGTV